MLEQITRAEVEASVKLSPQSNGPFAKAHDLQTATLTSARQIWHLFSLCSQIHRPSTRRRPTMKLSFALVLTMTGCLSGTQGFARPGANNAGRTAHEMVANPVEKAAFTQVSGANLKKRSLTSDGCQSDITCAIQ